MKDPRGQAEKSPGGARVRGYDLARLRAELSPFRLYWFPRLRSTNDHAIALRKRGDLFAPAVVLTANQTAGRGRGASVWWSAAGSITATFALPVEDHLSPEQLPLVAGLAVRNAAAQMAPDVEIGLKWPNDVIHEGLKLAGLLCERTHRVDLIGVGLNLNIDPQDAPAPLRARITSLYALAGQRFDPTDALLTLASHLRKTMLRRTQHPIAALLADYAHHHCLPGKRIRVTLAPGSKPVIGQCEGLDSIGRLLVRNSTGLTQIISGHVEEA